MLVIIDMSETSPLRSLQRIQPLMLFLSTRRSPAAFSELVRFLDVPDATLNRLLKDLLQLEWIESVAGLGYRTGPGWAVLMNQRPRKRNLGASVQPVLEKITQACGLPAALSIYTGASITFAATTRVADRPAYRSPGNVNRNIYKNGFALTHLPFEEDLMENLGAFDEIRSYSAYSRKDLTRVLKQIKKDKVFLSDEEKHTRLTLPMFTTSQKRCAAVVGVTGSRDVLNRNTYKTYLEILRRHQPEILCHL